MTLTSILFIATVLLVLLAGLIFLGNAYTPKQPQKYAAQPHPVPSRSAALSVAAPGNESNADGAADLSDDFFGNIKFNAKYAQLWELLQSGKYIAALNKLESEIATAEETDCDLLAEYVTDCYEGLAEGKIPTAALNLYDRLSKERGCIKFALEHGKLRRFAEGFSFSLQNQPDPRSKSELERNVIFITQDHPLLNATHEYFPMYISDYLDGQAQTVIADWPVGQKSKRPEAIINAINARIH